MTSSPTGSRWAQTYLDWDGNHVANWTMTPSHLTDPVNVIVDEPRDCIPLYPLRYGLTEENCRVDELDGVSIADYPAGPASKAYGLRLLRPRSIVYLFYQRDGQNQHLVYQVTAEATFSPLPHEAAANAAEGQSFAEQQDFWFPMGAMATPWLPVPKTDVTDTVYLLVTDTLLTGATLSDLSGKLEELSGTLLTKVRTDRLAEGQQDVLPVAGTLDNGTFVPEMRGGFDGPLQPADLSWSESRPEAPRGRRAVATLQRFFNRFNGERDDIEPLMPILHDPVGVMSELNHRLAMPLTALSEYCADNARKLRVKEMIERLGEARYAEIYDRNSPSDGEDDSPPRLHGVGIPAPMVAKARANLARRQRLSNYRAEDAEAFVDDYHQRIQQLASEVETAAAEQWSDWQGLQQRYHALLELFDETDDTNFLDLRVVVANTLTGLFHDEQGQAWLQSQFEGELPVTSSVLYRVLMGHPLVNDYVTRDRETAPQRFDLEQPSPVVEFGNSNSRFTAENVAGTLLARLQRVIDRLPDDAGSAQLGMTVAALSRARADTDAFWASPRRAMLEVLFGEGAYSERVLGAEVGNWFARAAGGSADAPFRPVNASNDPLYLVGTRKLESTGRSSYVPLKAALKAQAHFWHAARGLLGGLALWASHDSLARVLRQWDEEDGQALANSLNLGSAVLVVGGYGASLTSAGMGWAQDVRNDTPAGQRAGTLAERTSTWAIGLTAASALLVGLKEAFIDAKNESSDAGSLTITSSLIKFGETMVGSAHVLGKFRIVNDLLDRATSQAGRSLITRSVVGTAEGISSAVRISAGTVGWVLLGLEVMYSGIRAWHDQVVAERKFTDWIGRSCWGTGQNSDGDPMTGMFGNDDVEELRQFYRLFQAPQLKIQVNSPTYDPMGATIIESASSDVTIIFPGWQPQVSRFEVRHVYMGSDITAKRLADPDQLEIEEGYSILRYRTDAVGVDSNVDIQYWPNRFADPICVLYDEATEKRRDIERRDRLEQFQARQQGSAS